MSAWYRRSWVLAAGALVAFLGVVAVLLLVTPLGLRLGLALAPDGVTVAAVRGALVGGFELEDVRIATDAADVEVAHVRVEPALAALAGGTLRVRAVAIGPTVVTLRPGVATSEPAEGVAASGPPTPGPPTFELPVAVELERLTIAGLRVVEPLDGEEVVPFAVERIELSALTFDEARARLGALTVSDPLGELRLAGTARFASPFDVDLTLVGRYADQLTLSAGLVGDEAAYELDVTTEGVLVTDVGASLVTPWRDPRFGLDVELAVADLARLVDDPPIDRLAVSFSAGGSHRSVEATSRVTLPGIADLELVNDADLDLASGRVVVNRFEIAEVGLPGRLRASGTVSLDPKRPSSLLVTWRELARLRLAAAGLASDSGRIDVQGTVDDLTIDVAAGLSTSYGPGSVAGRLHHRPDEVTIEKLDVLLFDGVLELIGTLRYEDGLDARGTLAARELDLSELAGESVQVGLASRFDVRSVPDGLAGEVVLSALTGSLAGRPVEGEGRVLLRGEAVEVERFAAAVGRNELTVTGRVGPEIAIDATIDAPALGQLLPALAGSLRGEIHTSGAPDALAARVSLTGDGLAWEDASLASLALEADVGLASGAASRVRGELRDLAVGAQAVEAVTLTVDGTSGDHAGALEASATPGEVSLAWRGGLRDARYAGTLDALTIAPVGFEALSLASATPFEVGPERQALGRPLCLAAAGSELCAELSRSADDLNASLTLSELDLAPLGPLVDELAGAPLELEGLVSGGASIRASASGATGTPQAWEAEAQIDAPRLRVQLPMGPEPFVVGQEGLRLEVTLTPSALDAELDATLEPTGRLTARLAGDGPDPDAALRGDLTIEADDLAAFAPLVPEATDLTGRARLEARLAGTVGDPELILDGTVAEAGASLPAVGLQLSAGEAAVTLRPDGEGTLTAGLRSGNGRVDVAGDLAFEARRAVLTIVGERFLGMDTPEIRALVSPDLTVELEPERLAVRGTVTVPSLAVDLSALEGSVSASPDVEVAGRDDATTALPLDLDVTLRLGDDVRFSGFGLDGQLSGSVRASQRPGQALVCTGQLNIAGGVQAYGQDLTIERGRLLFSSVPCDDPSLDVIARREIATIGGVAGVEITGSAAFPELRLFSTPAREESEVLCMLVTGKGCGEADEDAVNQAVLAAGLSAGSAVTNRLGQQAGLDDLSLTSSDEFEGAGLTVGKYVAPRIYVSYGRSFANQAQYFETVYQLTRHVEISVRQALETITAIRYQIELK